VAAVSSSKSAAIAKPPRLPTWIAPWRSRYSKKYVETSNESEEARDVFYADLDIDVPVMTEHFRDVSESAFLFLVRRSIASWRMDLTSWTGS